MLIIIQERTLEEHNKLVEGILKRDKKRRKRIEAAGIDYECPEMVRANVLYYISRYLLLQILLIFACLLTGLGTSYLLVI